MIEVEILGPNGLKVVKLNRRKAIRERCLNCTNWSINAVSNCTSEECPLFSFRSGRGKQNAKERRAAIAKYCQWCYQKKSAADCPVITCPLYVYRQGSPDRSVALN